MIKKLLLTIVTFLVICQASAQVGTPTIIPPSPEAASVFKFTEVPVSLYAGLPTINIPLFEIQSGGVTVPISLSYHARGVKVAEIASRVGLGWALNAGGMVSRQIRGREDEAIKGYFTNYKDGDSVVFFSNPLRRYALSSFGGSTDVESDLIPDQYYFNTGTGLNGKFIIDYKDLKVLPQNYSNVNVFSRNKIIDAKGNQYFFDESETPDTDDVQRNYVLKQTGAPTYTEDDSPVVSNTWHLTKIKTATGHDIIFNYDQEETIYYRRSYDKFVSGASEIPGASVPSQYNSFGSTVKSTQSYISTITFDGGSIHFLYDTRLDLGGQGKRLRSVILYDKNGTAIQRKLLNYEYIDSEDGNTNATLEAIDPSASKRLFLKSVQTADKDSVLVPPYKFDYGTDKLPGRHSNAQDLWGYYNASNNGPFLTEYGGERIVNEVASEAGMLKKIIYPEGGSANFQYEHNKVFCGYPRSAVYFENVNPYVYDDIIMSAQIDGFGQPQDSIKGSGTGYDPHTKTYTRTFVIPKMSLNKAKYSASLVGSSNCPQSNPYCKYIIRIESAAHENESMSAVYRQLNHTGAMTFGYLDNLPSGTYRLKVRIDDSSFDPSASPPLYHFVVTFGWYEALDSSVGIIYAGGKRIKKIEYKDSQDNLQLMKTYDYNNPDTGTSSGMLFGLPNFLGKKEGFANGVYHSAGNGSGSPLSTYQESSIGYGVVTEYIGDSTNNVGKTEYKYTMTAESNDFYTFPFHPPPDHEWMRGKELSRTDYKKTNSTINPYIHVRKTENTYLYAGEEGGIGDLFSLPYRSPIDQNLDCPPVASGEPIFLQCTNSGYKKNRKMFRLPLGAIYYDDIELMYKVYHLTGGTMDLLSTKTTDYFDNGGEMQSETNYFYDYDEHYNVASVEKKDSYGQTNTTKYLYPGDSEMDTEPFVADLRLKNMLDTPLLTQTLIGSDILSTQKTIFKNWGNISTTEASPQLAPQYLQVSKGTNNLENKVEYVNVDFSNGNPLEVKQTNGNSICYIWGYNKTKPIAKIENATSGQVEGALALGLQLKDVSETDLPAINSLRNTLPQAMVTTMTYLPLIGVSTITAPNGQKTSYFYDDLNRLERVEDHLGNIITKNEYFYAAPTN